CALYAMDYW
nr:immunoglobulin heavy chain junction region [Mus musculus]